MRNKNEKLKQKQWHYSGLSQRIIDETGEEHFWLTFLALGKNIWEIENMR